MRLSNTNAYDSYLLEDLNKHENYQYRVEISTLQLLTGSSDTILTTVPLNPNKDCSYNLTKKVVGFP